MIRSFFVHLPIALCFFSASLVSGQSEKQVLEFNAYIASTRINTINQSLTNQAGIYFTEAYTPAKADNYLYKRILKYKEPALAIIGYDVSGNAVVGQPISGAHFCSLIDYYSNGRPAVVATVASSFLTCAHGSMHGPANFYYENGQISGKANYNIGKLQGPVIYYLENGKEWLQYYYENGNRIEKDRFPVSPDCPLLGTWKFVEYAFTGLNFGGKEMVPPTIKRSITITLTKDAILENKWQELSQNGVSRMNWNYLSKDNASGVLEIYIGNDLVQKSNISWINRDQFEMTTTFSKDAGSIGNKLTFRR
jgi:hypothetical protein